MQVSLKKAAALAAALPIPAVTRPSAEFTIFEDLSPDQIADRITEVELKFNDAVQNLTRVIDARWTIRRLIGQANEGLINGLIAERAKIDAMLQSLSLLEIELPEPAPDVIARQIERLKENGADNYGRYQTSVSVPVGTVTQVTPVIKELKRRRVQVEDELARLNFTTTIKLPSEVVDVLRDNDLI